MRWIRLNRRIGAWAALFALAVQMTLSFGHVHLNGIAPPSRLGAHVQQWQSADRGTPINPSRHSDAQDFCAICATIAMVASSVIPAPAPLPAPIATPFAWTREFDVRLISRQPHILFQARAPPFIG